MTSQKTEKPMWLKRNKEEIEALVIKLAKQGLTSEKIGLVLRDTYGIPSIKSACNKISEILEREGLKQEPCDTKNLKRKSAKLRLHIERNKQDKVAKRGLQLTEAKIIKLSKYYSQKRK